MSKPADETEGKGFTVVDRRGSSDSDAERSEARPQAEPSQGAAPSRESANEPHEIDFATFVMSLGSSALFHLGELPEPGEPPHPPNFPLAKQTIDILGMLAEKTRGNLSSEEARLLEHLLYDLRLKYVEARKRK